MIRYAIYNQDISTKIETVKPGWLQRAKQRTRNFIAAGAYEETSTIWSEIKPAFMEIQFNKCVYCERQLSDGTFGKIEHDLEHFRPKSKVMSWPSGKSGSALPYSVGLPNPNGYFWLAYDTQNYAAACKVCNNLKSAAFPIAGPRGASPSPITKLTRTEKPFLCNPIIMRDTDPEELINFVGTTAKAAASRGHKKRRGEVIIQVFRLNDRDDLLSQRANEICHLGLILERIDVGDEIEKFENHAQNLIADNRPHAGCKRNFWRLWKEENNFARRLLEAAREQAY